MTATASAPPPAGTEARRRTPDRAAILAEVARPIAPERHLGRIVFGALAAVVVTAGAAALWFNPALDHETIFANLTVPTVLEGVVTTIGLAVVAMIVGIVGGFLVAAMRLSQNPVLRAIGLSYVLLLRSIPLLVLILFIGNLSLFWSQIDVVNPFNQAEIWVSWRVNDLITPFIASVLALSLNESAYLAEIFRSGVKAVDPGQWEAGTALGLGRRRTMFAVILPQTLRVILPPVGSQFVTMLKMTSLVSVIAGGDLLTATENIAATNLRTLELLVVASLWYLLITGIATIGQTLLERRFERGQRKVVSR